MKHCLNCLKEVSTSLRCARCRTALYCSKACQKKHKNICEDSNNAEDSNEKLFLKAKNQYHQGRYISFLLYTYSITNN